MFEGQGGGSVFHQRMAHYPLDVYIIRRAMHVELLEEAIFYQIAEPEEIGRRTIKLQKILFCFRSIAAVSQFSVSQRCCTETLPMRQCPGAAIPELKRQGNGSPINAHVGNSLRCPIDGGQAFLI